MPDVFLVCKGFDVAGTLGKIKRSSDFMSPVFEALGNALDATASDSSKPVTLTFEFRALGGGSAGKRLDSVEIEDFGVGFNDENYARFLSLNDRSKSPLNKGSGRVQFIKAFERADVESVFLENDVLMKRAFSISASSLYLKKNALIRETTQKTPADDDATKKTTVRLLAPFTDDKTRRFEESTAKDIKARVLSRFFLRLNGREETPQIDVVFRVNGAETERETISPHDKIAPRKVVEITVPGKRASGDSSGRRFVKDGRFERFTVTGYALRSNAFARNVEAFVSRGEVVEDAKLNLADPREKIDGFFYVVAVSGDRIDAGVLESRDRVLLPSDRDFRAASLFEDGADVSLEDVQNEARKACVEIFPELETKRKELKRRIERVGERFGFAESSLAGLEKKLPLNADDEDVLKKLYSREATASAKNDAEINELLESVGTLDPTATTYAEESRERADRLFELTPEQNRANLAHYFARRKITLETFERAVNDRLDVQTRNGRSREESVLHNVLFRTKSQSPTSSDLWILDEEFVYFSGTSDVPLADVLCDGKKLLTSLENCTPTEREFLKDRKNKRPDILLFPEEGKCVVVELKAPDVDLAKHIGQATRYASLIFNYAAPEFKFDRFYLYLIGGRIEPRDIYGADEHFQFAPKGDYMFKTSPLRSFTTERPDGEAYYEIHTYETICRRAKARNKTFLDMLLKNDK